MKIGSRQFDTKVVLAPMAGVTDVPFRARCRSFGLDLMISEMISSKPQLRSSAMAQERIIVEEGAVFRWVQILGNDPREMADTAIQLEGAGVDCIDINMGCPVKKVCNRAAGSALLRDESLVASILVAVTSAVRIPVTLKTRTGWSRDLKNGLTIARIAEDSGIAAITIHGRTRECRFSGAAEYDTVAAVKDRIGIPVIANGDLTDAVQVAQVIEQTGVDAVMIGRGALGRPWFPAQVEQFLRVGWIDDQPQASRAACMMKHTRALHDFYGTRRGVRIARKHLGWYLDGHPSASRLFPELMAIESSNVQLDFLERHFVTDPCVINPSTRDQEEA